MESVGAEKAEKEFQELLDAYWAAQLAQLGRQSGPDQAQAAPDSLETAVKEGDAR